MKPSEAKALRVAKLNKPVHIIYDSTGAIACKHRNKNEGCGTQQVFYKGKHSKSFSSSEHKMGAMIGTCYRIQRNSFNDGLPQEQMKEKTREWRECLQYSNKFIASAIKYLANKHTNPINKAIAII